MNVVSELDPKLEQRSPNVFADLPQFSPGLADEAGPRSLGYVVARGAAGCDWRVGRVANREPTAA